MLPLQARESESWGGRGAMWASTQRGSCPHPPVWDRENRRPRRVREVCACMGRKKGNPKMLSSGGGPHTWRGWARQEACRPPGAGWYHQRRPSAALSVTLLGVDYIHEYSEDRRVSFLPGWEGSEQTLKGKKTGANAVMLAVTWRNSCDRERDRHVNMFTSRAGVALRQRWVHLSAQMPVYKHCSLPTKRNWVGSLEK